MGRLLGAPNKIACFISTMKIITTLILAAASTSFAGDCYDFINRTGGTIVATQVGKNTFFSDGRSATTLGKNTFFSDGVVATQVGKNTFISGGEPCELLRASRLLHSDE